MTVRAQMTRDELLRLPVSVDLVTAGRALGMGRTTAHEQARRGEFPIRVLRVGRPLPGYQGGPAPVPRRRTGERPGRRAAGRVTPPRCLARQPTDD